MPLTLSHGHAGKVFYFFPPFPHASLLQILYFRVVISFLTGPNGALDLVAPLFERLRVFPIPSEENLSFTDPRPDFRRDPGPITLVGTGACEWEESVNSLTNDTIEVSKLVQARIKRDKPVPFIRGYPLTKRLEATVPFISSEERTICCFSPRLDLLDKDPKVVAGSDFRELFGVIEPFC